MKIGTILLAVGLAAFLGFVIWGFQAAWKLGGDSVISTQGYIAMGIAAVFTLLLGGGLMWLAFYSSRKGFDQSAHGQDEDDAP